MNSDTVKPMPPSTATPATWCRPVPGGSAPRRVRTASVDAPRMPTNLPTTRPATMPMVTRLDSAWSIASPLSTTPALARAKIGTIRKLDTGCSAPSSRSSTGHAASRARGREQTERRHRPASARRPLRGGTTTTRRRGSTYATGWSTPRRDITTTSRVTSSAPHEPPSVEPTRVEERDHDDGTDVVDDREREQEQLQARRHTRAEQREHAHRERDVGGHRDAPSRRVRRRRRSRPRTRGAGITMPPSAAIAGSAAAARSRSSPTTSSRLISSPTTKKNTAMSASFTQCTNDSVMARSPGPRVSSWCHQLV